MGKKKILYPVGTAVTLRKHPEIEGLIVTDYKKGEKYPYRVGFFEGDQVSTEDGKSKFSVKGLKRYSPTRTKVSEEVASKQKSEPGMLYPVDKESLKQCDRLTNVYTREEVDAIVNKVVDNLLDTITAVHEDLHSDLLRVAKVSDSNFLAVSKKFKTLSHNDD